MNIFGAGLNEWELSSITTFLDARKILPIQERMEEGVPDEFIEHASISRLFAFWLQIGMIRQDRPVYFHLGLIFIAYALINVSTTLGVKLWQLLTT